MSPVRFLHTEEKMLSHAVLQYSQDDVKNIQQHFQMTPELIQTNLDVLKVWISQQKHLPQILGDDFLERAFLKNKCRIEKTKQKIDSYFTLRGIYSEFYLENNEKFVPSLEKTTVVAFPLLLPSLERVAYFEIRTSIPEEYDQLRSLQFMVLFLEIIMRNDYSIGEKIIFNLRNATLEHLKRATVTNLSKAISLYRESYSGRISSIDFVNAPTHIGLILNLFKFALPAKIHQRIKVHKTLDSLYEVIPKSHLPEDLGGDLESVNEMNKKWDSVFDEYRKFFNENSKNVSNEKLRVGDLPKSDYFGVDGSFKKLALD